jgi:hypothetical protein
MLALQLILNYRELRKIAGSGFKALAEVAVPIRPESDRRFLTDTRGGYRITAVADG